jgi:hypothetical protein
MRSPSGSGCVQDAFTLRSGCVQYKEITPKKGEKEEAEEAAAFLSPSQDEDELTDIRSDHEPKPEIEYPDYVPESYPVRIDPQGEWDAMDWAFCLPPDGAEGVSAETVRNVQKAVYYHLKKSTDSFWRKRKVFASEDKLVKSIRTMIEQVPDDYALPGSLFYRREYSDPQCCNCGGRGFTKVQMEGYTEGIMGAVRCSCIYEHPAPWRLELPEAA